MKFASIIPASLFSALLLFLGGGGFVSSSVGQESRWGSPGEETVKFIIAAETKWANSACSPQPDLKEVIADDFQGTSPSGRRYGKKDAISHRYQGARARLSTGRGKGEIFRRLHRDRVWSGKRGQDKARKMARRQSIVSSGRTRG